ncbi:hypothetical protein PQG02_33875 (plasmid) [Nostoc sp. UHCC 0926]|uniref:hypothetical protein n=1 Tax=Nostoc sp. UHCC 0926 TaxID=3025190 RepID=UPI0023604DC8|nr:hypothetical protein [Nostoc sp. UHCC 0926]WDD36837.1 hypothetical protein PQG02_33875 [Nostoc sp. UHCC 0926]
MTKISPCKSAECFSKILHPVKDWIEPCDNLKRHHAVDVTIQMVDNARLSHLQYLHQSESLKIKTMQLLQCKTTSALLLLASRQILLRQSNLLVVKVHN